MLDWRACAPASPNPSRPPNVTNYATIILSNDLATINRSFFVIAPSCTLAPIIVVRMYPSNKARSALAGQFDHVHGRRVSPFLARPAFQRRECEPAHICSPRFKLFIGEVRTRGCARWMPSPRRPEKLCWNAEARSLLPPIRNVERGQWVGRFIGAPCVMNSFPTVSSS
jgi:hypothetical protein